MLFPIIWLLAKSSDMSMQSILHALFLPTPFKRTLAQLSAATHGTAEPSSEKKGPAKDESQAPPAVSSFTEVLKPGALYRECSVVMLPVAPLPPADPVDDKKAKEKEGEKPASQEDLLEIEDDGEYGGEGVGRVVWEWFENHLKMWEAREKERNPGSEDVKAASG